MKRPRLRKRAKWACTIAAGAAVGVAVFSGFYVCELDVDSNGGDTRWCVGSESGLLWAKRISGWLQYSNRPSPSFGAVRWRGWNWGYAGEVPKPWRGFDWHAGVVWSRDPEIWTVGVSLLYPVLLTTIPAAFLWYTDRRRFKPGSCGRCGYDRAGLAADAKCPECGAVPSSDPVA